jgi:hypothetical protein
MRINKELREPRRPLTRGSLKPNLGTTFTIALFLWETLGTKSWDNFCNCLIPVGDPGKSAYEAFMGGIGACEVWGLHSKK